jgi:predicted RNase H-like nuclease (RuvC/YqgF family)
MVAAIAPGSAAEQCGAIMVGDVVESINDVNAATMKISDVRAAATGAFGSSVSFEFSRSQDSKRYRVDLMRGSSLYVALQKHFGTAEETLSKCAELKKILADQESSISRLRNQLEVEKAKLLSEQEARKKVEEQESVVAELIEEKKSLIRQETTKVKELEKQMRICGFISPPSFPGFST